MFVVGLTGGIGSGKSEATRIFASLGVPIVDVDVISHQLTAAGQPILKEIIAFFGEEFLLENGELNRKAISRKIFADSALRLRLEAILHPAIYDKALQELAKNSQAPYQILAIPLLFEGTRYQPIIQRSLLIDCDASLQISRTMQRSSLPEKTVRDIMAIQVSREVRRALASDIVENNGNIEQLRTKITKIHENYIHTCIVSE
ncbi:MAG: dephospho-CoA kinase [Methylophilaceae bacterium]|nr:dephospho-CoA kinase [Methylophilaceae bacterium]